jgi:hypothetical protein
VRARTRAHLFAGSAYDPTAAAGRIAWQRPSGLALIRRAGGDEALPGSHPALGGDRVAWIEGDRVVIADAATSTPLERRDAPGAGAVAISPAHLTWRARDAAGTDRLWLDGELVFEVAAPAELGRPSLSADRLLFHVAGPAGGGLLELDLLSGTRRTLRSDPGAQLSNPATDGSRLLYVRATGRSQELRLGILGPARPRDDALLLEHPSAGQRDVEHERGRHRHRQGPDRPQPLPPRARPGVVETLWTTALTPDTAYVTRLRAQRAAPRTADILSVPAGQAG